MIGRPAVSEISELAALLVGARGRRQASTDRIATLSRRVDETELIAYLHRLGIFTLAVGHLLDSPGGHLSANLRDLHQQSAFRFAERNRLLAVLGTALCEALEQAGIPALTLKGPRLAARVHGDLSARISADLDLLVPSAQLWEAASTCQMLGYRLPPDLDPAQFPPLHIALTHASGALPDLDLHWRLHWYEAEYADGLLHRSTMADGERQPAPIDELASLLLFYARDGFVGLRLPGDIAAWQGRFAASGDAEAFAELLGRHPPLRPAWLAARRAANLVTGADPLGGADRSPAPRRAVLASRLANWDFVNSVGSASATVSLADGLLTPRGGRGRWLRRAFLLPAGPGGSKLGPTALKRLLHPPKTLVRFAITLAVTISRGSARPTLAP